MTENRLDSLLKSIYSSTYNLMGQHLQEVILYGSYARGDYDNESDLDIALIVDMNRQDVIKYRKPLAELVSNYCLSEDVLISFSCIPGKDFEEYKEALPYYRNINQEGVRLNA